MQLRVSPAAPPRALSESLVCPRCRTPLQDREAGLVCPAPAAAGSIRWWTALPS
ncbi:Trm112 family protein [Skermanella pratensis]|uniref:Trm112 family protein n=1 Tax=Skermanella pratensis TaxID=2233999 RepID=UPI003CCC96E3